MVTTWMTSEVGKKDALPYGAGSAADGTGFRSAVTMKRFKNGPKIPYEKEKKDGKTKYVWPDIPSLAEVEYRVETLAKGNGKEGASDRVNIILTRIDMEYLVGLVNQVVANYPEGQVPADTNVILQEVMAIVDPTQLTDVVRNNTVETNSSGIYEGSFLLEREAFRDGMYMLTCHYGYSGASERSDLDKSQWWDVAQFVIEELIVLAIFAVLCALGVIGTAVSAGTSLLLCAVGVSFVANVALGLAVAGAFMYNEYLQTAFGLIDTNKYDANFPLGGFNHIYSFSVGGPDAMGVMMQDLASQKLIADSKEIQTVKPPIPVGSSTAGIWLVLLVLAGLGTLAVSLMGGGEE